MKFGIRECANIVFRAKKKVKIGNSEFNPGQPVLYIDTATTSTLEQASSTVYAQGGRGNARLIAWEGDKTLTFTVEDALLSPIGYAVLSGAGLFKGKSTDTSKVHFHMTSMAILEVVPPAAGSSDPASAYIDLTDAIASYPNAEVCISDAPLYVMEVDEDGSVTGDLFVGNAGESVQTVTVDGVTYKSKIAFEVAPYKKSDTTKTPISSSVNVMVDYYIDLPGKQVFEADITENTFAGYYYVEADTLFRQQSTGKDLPANLTFPNVKIQSNFTIAMAGTGDPSTFTFTMDAFPGYTYFDKTKKVLCVLQIMDEVDESKETMKPVMPHNTTIEHNSVSGFLDMSEDSPLDSPKN